MSGIWNVSMIQNPQTKKTFSKISFEVGEKFNARILSVSQDRGELNLKLSDGWQFSAKLDKPLEYISDSNVLKFEVEGFEDGKLKIKLVYEDTEENSLENDILEDFLQGENISVDKKDALLFQKMIKHNIPLTKDNIIDIKNLMDFREKILLNENQEEVFIDRYLNSRNIDPNSENAKEITKILKEFFQVLKNLDANEILLFKENNIELTKGNMESFIKLFKGSSTIYNTVKDINNYFLNLNKSENIIIQLESDDLLGSTEGLNNKGEHLNKLVEKVDLKQVLNLINKELTALSVDSRISKASIEECNGQSIEINSGTMKVLVDNVFNQENIEVSPEQYDKLMNKLEEKLGNIREFNLKEILKQENPLLNQDKVNYEQEEFTKLSSEDLLGSTEGLNSKGKSLNKLIEKVDLKQVLNLINKELTALRVDSRISKASIAMVKGQSIEINSGTMKVLVDNVFKQENIELSLEQYNKLMNNLEDQLSDFKKLNNNSAQNENKNISNIKTSAYGKNNSMNEVINMIKKELSISEIDRGNINNIQDKLDKITTDVLVKEEIKLKTGEIKSILKNLIGDKLNLKPEMYDKVMSTLEQKVNDIKIFNSLSEQYYYLDLPIDIKENKYQCKLVVKDDRKKGKKIDSKNVKIATSIKTINMGTVDAYIKVSNINMDIDITCDEMWIKFLELGREKLINDLSSMNYRVNINLASRVNEFTLSNCREFFDDRSFNTINIKV